MWRRVTYRWCLALVAELDADLPMVLLMSGGRDVFEIYPKLLTVRPGLHPRCARWYPPHACHRACPPTQIKTPAQIVVITGRQADVRAVLAKHEVRRAGHDHVKRTAAPPPSTRHARDPTAVLASCRCQSAMW